MQITAKQYLKLNTAYDYFNEKLFENKLPGCLITLQREKMSKGYYSAKRFKGKHEEKQIDEIALNPDLFGRSEKDILSTLVHEMCHQWDNHFGLNSQRTYHNKVWSKKMQEVGLMPSADGKPGGRRTGQYMTHYVIENGLFDKIVKDLLKDYIIDWFSEDYFDIQSYLTTLKKRLPGDPFSFSNIDKLDVGSYLQSAGVVYNVKNIDTDNRKVEVEVVEGVDTGDSENSTVTVISAGIQEKKKNKKKTVYICPRCKVKVWGKPELSLICGSCYSKGDGIIYLNNELISLNTVLI